MNADRASGDNLPASSDAIVSTLADMLLDGALPGEADGLDPVRLASVATFVAASARERQPGEPAICLDSSGSGESGRRQMRLAVINDDMPFLVDSISAVFAAQGIEIFRLLHPIIAARRDADGILLEILPPTSAGERTESIIYLELERVDARIRRSIETELRQVLGNVRAAVRDWPRMQLAMRDAADGLPDGEGASLLRWFLDGNFTMLGHRIEDRDGAITTPIGIFDFDPAPVWSDGARAAAVKWFEQGKAVPLLLKADRTSLVHRRVPLDLVVLPVRDGAAVTGVSIHTGLWTSAAMQAPSDDVPILRRRLALIERDYGFGKTSHAAKALRHALSTLPHDLLVSFDPETLEDLALSAMSLADRPRPRLIMVPGALRRQLFAFVWLPRDELSTDRRRVIGDMIGAAANAPLTGWSLELDTGELALIRYTFALADDATIPDEEPLDRKLSEMLRGWTPAVELALGQNHGATRAARLALRFSSLFPDAYRDRYGATEAAADIDRLDALGGDVARGVRLYRAPHDEGTKLRLKIYRRGGLMALSEVVPVLENFGFTVLKEVPTRLYGDVEAQIYEFLVSLDQAGAADELLSRAKLVEQAIAAVLCGDAENDSFNELIIGAGLDPRSIVLFRAWFRYLRQTGMSYGMETVVSALRKAPEIAGCIIAMFDARNDPAIADTARGDGINAEIDEALVAVTAIDDDRIIRRLRDLVLATLRTNAFTAKAGEALAFKLQSNLVPGLPAPVPWREIWVYSPRVEGIHLRGGPIARGGLRWSDRRDDFRTEILGLMKAQVVKNAVIVPTGAKGGFYPKQLPPPGDREAWLAEGTESYRIFIRTLLSITDNIVGGETVHPEGIVIHDDPDPYFVVAADKGTATFSDTANAIAVEHGFWLGDAFASGGSQGYDHKAMGITARGAWISVQRHFAEMGVDVQTDSISVVGCGDMSGDVFGNGMLLSRTLKLLAAFDHRHIFIDPNPDAEQSWIERDRLFQLPRSSWADYDAKLISKGGGIFPRTQKQIPISAEAGAVLGIAEGQVDPSTLISAILKAPVDLLWFGGIGTYVKAANESNLEVGDTANDAHRVNGDEVRARAIGEGANLGVTQAGRIAFSAKGGRINTDFIDNSAGVDCSDNEVNIKIPLNREMIEGRLEFEDRNAFLREMTDDVAAIVLEDNRLQTLALSLAERGGEGAVPGQVRVIEMLEASGRVNRKVEGLASNEELLRRTLDGRGLTRPELAVLLSHSKLALQAAIESSTLALDPLLVSTLREAFPEPMRKRFAKAIDAHQLRGEIIATKLANRIINRLGFVVPFELADEQGVSLAQVAAAYVAVDNIFALRSLWRAIEQASVTEEARLELFSTAGTTVRLLLSDMLRVAPAGMTADSAVQQFGPGIKRLDEQLDSLLKAEAIRQSDAIRGRLASTNAPELVERIVRLAALDGAIGLAAMTRRRKMDEVQATQAYTLLGERLGLDWAKAAVIRHVPQDQWEQMLVANLDREFETLRLDFLAHHQGTDPVAAVEHWLETQAARVRQFQAMIDRARQASVPSVAMLAQIAVQARMLFARAEDQI